MEHFLNELENDKENITASIKKVDRELLMKTDVALHEFIQWPTFFVYSDKDWRGRAAFLVHATDFFDVSHRALMEALAGYYSNGFILLRNAFELIIRGALWECLSHPEFRAKSDVLRASPSNIGGCKRTILDWLDDCCTRDISVFKKMDAFSCIILDIVSPLYSDKNLNKFTPKFKTIIEQLSVWAMFDPIKNPLIEIYDVVYWDLSKDSHGAPDRTLIGRRLAAEGKPFEHNIFASEINSFCSKLERVIDIGFVMELNILSDLLKSPKNIKILETKLQTIKELNLPITTAKIETLIGKN